MFSTAGRSTRGGTVAALLCLGLAACGSNSSADSSTDEAKAQTLPQSAASSSAATEAEEAEEVTQPEPLTKAKAKKALLKVQDMPTGWAEGEASDSDSGGGTFKPARCSVMGGSAKNRTSLATAQFAGTGTFGPSLQQEIYRPKKVSPAERLTELREVMADCDTYTVKDADGTSTMKLSGLSFPDLGDGTLAVRGKLTTASGLSATDDVLYIAVGDVILRMDSISIGEALPAKDLERMARKAVKKLEKVS